MIVKGKCQVCGGPMEFEAEASGTMIACPHCQQSTELIIGKTEPSKPKPASKPVPPSPRTDSGFKFQVTHLILIALLVQIGLTIGGWYRKPPAPVTWQVSEFKFTEAFTTDKYTGTRYQTMLQYSDNDPRPGVFGLIHREPEFVGSADQVLNYLGWDGWELAWSDGVRYIVKRPEGRWQHAYFGVIQEVCTNTAAK